MSGSDTGATVSRLGGRRYKRQGCREEGNQFTQKVQRPTQRGLFVVSEDETKEEAEGKET